MAQQLSAYEELRKERMEANARYLAELGLGDDEEKKKKQKTQMTTITSVPLSYRRKTRRFEKRAALRSGGMKGSWPGREREIGKLIALLAGPPTTMVIAGPAATGKTSILRAVIEASGEPFAWISCATLPRGASAGALAAFVLARAGRDFLAYTKGKDGSPTTPWGLAKVAAEAAEAEGYDDDDTPVFSIVLDDAGLVLADDGSWTDNDVEAHLVGALEFASTLRVRFRIIIVGDDRALAMKLRWALRIDFPAYRSDDLIPILIEMARRRHLIPLENTKPFRAFVAHIVAIARRVTTDVRDLIKLAASKRLFAIYANDDPATAYAKAKPILQHAVDRLHDPFLDVDAIVLQELPPLRKNLIDLPVHSRYLLLAAFIGTSSSKDSDKLLFTTSGDNAKKKKKIDASSAKNTGDSIDATARKTRPLAVPLDRILSIHAHIVASHLGTDLPIRSDAVLSALAGLVQNNLIARVSTFDDLSQLKFKCLLVTDDALQLAHTLRFDLPYYLRGGGGGR